MSRLKKYLIESFEPNYDAMAELIRKDCGPWIKESRGATASRGISRNKPKLDNIEKRTIRTNRVPKDTSIVNHTLSDLAFKDVFGWKARSNVLFVQGDVLSHLGYISKDIWVVYPIGSYKYLWAPQVRDFTLGISHMEIASMKKTGDYDEFGEHDKLQETPIYKKHFLKLVTTFIKKHYKSTGLYKALTTYSNNEVMLNCKDYYLIPLLMEYNEIGPRLKK